MTGLETWRTRHGDTVEIYRAGDGFRYRVKAANGRIGDVGGEAYTRADDAAEAALRHHPVVNDLTPEDEEALEAAIAEVTESLIEHTTDDEPVTAEDLIEHTPAGAEQ